MNTPTSNSCMLTTIFLTFLQSRHHIYNYQDILLCVLVPFKTEATGSIPEQPTQCTDSHCWRKSLPSSDVWTAKCKSSQNLSLKKMVYFVSQALCALSFFFLEHIKWQKEVKYLKWFLLSKTRFALLIFCLCLGVCPYVQTSICFGSSCSRLNL